MLEDKMKTISIAVCSLLFASALFAEGDATSPTSVRASVERPGRLNIPVISRLATEYPTEIGDKPRLKKESNSTCDELYALGEGPCVAGFGCGGHGTAFEHRGVRMPTHARASATRTECDSVRWVISKTQRPAFSALVA
jgi:hypothetical protein